MTGTLPGADVRGFYRALGVELAGWAEREAPVGCFVDPGAHAHGDRDPSCSVNLESGAWHCWACGAAGGAYDAALARGLSARDTIELMIAHGLTTRRTEAPARRRPFLPPAGRRRRRSAREARPAASSWTPMSGRSGRPAHGWPRWCGRLGCSAATSGACLLELGCGWERGRVIVPIRNHDGELRGVLRYAPSHDHAPKVLAVRGTRLGLIPHPALEAEHVARVMEMAAWLRRRRRRWCRKGALPVLWVVHATRLERVEAGVLIVSLDRLIAALRTAAGTRHCPAFLSPIR